MINYLRSLTRVLVKTGLAALVPFIPALANDFEGTWLLALLTIALAVVVAAATALVSLPDTASQGWFVATIAKALRQFGQMIVAATASAALLTDVDWPTILKAGAVSAITTLVIAAVTSIEHAPTVVVIPEEGTSDQWIDLTDPEDIPVAEPDTGVYQPDAPVNPLHLPQEPLVDRGYGTNG